MYFYEKFSTFFILFFFNNLLALSSNIQGKIKATTNLGRGVGRLIPNIGAALIVIDIIQLLIEVYEFDKKNNKVIFKGFGSGGSFGGGGSSGYW